MIFPLHQTGWRIATHTALLFLFLGAPLAASDESDHERRSEREADHEDDREDHHESGRGHHHGGDHGHRIEEVVVHGHLLDGSVSQSTNVLDGEELEHAARHSIGETLAQTPGVHTASFGPAVGHPVIHGLSGTRVLVMENHVSSLDVAVTGGDHGITVEPFLADRIEVTKGSGTLLYGSGAMGGTVDVHTHRVPVHIPEKALSGRVLLRGDTGSDTRYGGFRLDGGGGQWAWHLDGYRSENGDVSIPGYALLDPHHDEEEEEHHDEEEDHDEEEHHEDEPLKGVLENAFGDYAGGAFGAAFHGSRGHIGAAIVVRDWTYGIVGEHIHGEEEHDEEDEHHEEEGEEEAHEEEHEDEHGEASPWIVLEQTKLLSEFGLNDPLPGFSRLEGTFVVSDYQHDEIESDGVVASHFANEAWETRVALQAEPLGAWEAAIGVQFGQRDFVFAGDASFEPVETNHRAVFGVARREFESVNVETGARLEFVEHAHASGIDRDFLASSFSAGVMIPVEPWEITARLDRSMRAPEGEELFAAGTHLAIGGFQMGSSDLDAEKSLNLSAGAVYRKEGMELTLEGYRYAFDDFIYQRQTEDRHDGLPIIQWWQSEATLVGVDAQARIELVTRAEGTADLVLGYDRVTTEIDDPNDDYLPRIPPQRLSIAAEFTWKDFWGRVAYTHYSDQDEATSYETPTDGYGNLDIEGEYATHLGDAELVLFVAGRNLGDEEQREHTSFVKDEAPLAGRRVAAGVRIWF